MTAHTGASRTITFREHVRLEDEQAVRRMAEATGFFRADEVEVAGELVRERLSKGAASGYEFVLGDAGTDLIGYACFGEIACSVGSYDLYWIIVDPAHQGRGLGRQLVDRVEERVRALGGRNVYIETSSLAKYEPTRRFYDRCGYAIEAVLRGFYQPGDDKLIYSKHIGTQTPAD